MKYFLLHASFLILSIANVLAQPFSFEKMYSHNVMSYNGMARILNSNNSDEAIIIGTAEIGAAGDGETVAIKTDSSGNILNTLIMGKPMYHDVCVQAMRLGTDYFFTGYTRSTDTSASPLFTSFVVKTDDNLNVVWQRNYIFPGNDLFFKTASVTASGDFLFCGNNFEFSSGNWYSFVLKTNANGNVLFCKMSNAFLSFDPGFITELSNHDILVTGSVTLGFEMVMPTAVRFDSLGNMKWAKLFDYSIGSTQQSKFLFAKELPSGNILLTGHSDYQSAANIGLMDYQVFKVDSGGNAIWMKTYGAGQVDWLYGADFNSATSELIMTGTSQSYVSNSSFYGYVVSVDTSGAVTNAFIQGDTLTGHQILLYNTSMLSSGNYIFSGAEMSGQAGFYESKFQQGVTGPSSCNTFDVTANSLSAVYPEFIYSVTPFPLDISIQINAITFDYYTGVNDTLLCYNNVTSIDEARNNIFSVYPNPATDIITFKVGASDLLSAKSIKADNTQVKIYNLFGSKMDCKIISHKISGEGFEITVDVSQLPPGIYFAETGNKKIRFLIN